jgi:hypothetical protein
MNPTLAPPPPENSRRDRPTLVDYDQFIDAQIDRTRRTVKLVDIASTLLVVVIASLGYLLGIAVVEHWIIPGGFGIGMRLLLAAILFGGLGYYAVRRFWPAAVRSINPVYAARTIEQSSPNLKNSLLNLLLFRQHREELSPAVYDALEEQAAQRLSHVPIESAVDHAPIIRLGYILLAVMVVASLYQVLSPKDPLTTAGRILVPWSDVPPPSRVTIDNIAPGNITVARGQRVEISAEVHGLRESEGVMLRYTTEDDQAVDRPAAMASESTSNFQFKGQLPQPSAYDSLGLLQDVRYRIEAGDAVSREFRIKVVPTPAIFVRKIEFDYPEYTGYVDRVVEDEGNLRAIEGTVLTIHAEANSPIQEAFVDFEADGRRDLAMKIDGSEAQASFTVALRPDRRTPQHASYALRFENADGQPNREPPQYEIDVLPDLSPEIEFVSPQESVRDVRLHETVVIQVVASDPDFALSEVRLLGETDGRRVLDEPILQSKHSGKFTGQFRLTPSQVGLQPGDVVDYWAVARDNRAPQANETSTKRQTLRIIAPDPNQPPPDQGAQRDPQDRNPDEQPQPDKAPGENADGGEQQPGKDQAGEGQEGQQGKGQQGERDGPGEPNSSQDGIERGAPDQQNPSAGGAKPGQNERQPSGDSQPKEQPGQPGGESRPQDGAQQNEKGAEGERGDNRGGDPSDQEAQDDWQPVSPSGEDDGEAFERLVQHFQDNKPGTPQGDNRDAGEGEASRDQSAAEGQEKRQPSSDQPQTGMERGKPRDEKPTDPSKSTEGSRPDGEGRPDEATQSESQNGAKPNAGEETPTDGQSGKPDQPGTGQAPPDAEDILRERLQQEKPGDKPDDTTEPPMQGNNRRQSDSQGEEGGDRTGGGEEGAGQQAPREGTGSDGQNQSADKGAGQSSEPGAGETSPSGGEDVPSDKETGQPGDQSQPGGSTERDATGQQPGGKPGQDQSPGEQYSNGDNEEGSQQPGSQGTPQGGGLPGAGNEGGQAVRPGSSEPGGDDPNLAYTRKQTELVLEKLADQLNRDEVDRELLDRLGWTEEDLRRFVERWQQLNETARQGDERSPAAQKELDDALRSLGLKPPALSDPREVTEDELRDLRRGIRGPVPLEYQERLRAYNQGVSRESSDSAANDR